MAENGWEIIPGEFSGAKKVVHCPEVDHEPDLTDLPF